MNVMSASSLSWKVLRYFRDPVVPMWRKLLGLAAVAYVVLPVDVIPDVIPVLGWLDDLGVVSAAAAFMLREIHRHAASATLTRGERTTPPHR